MAKLKITLPVKVSRPITMLGIAEVGPNQWVLIEHDIKPDGTITDLVLTEPVSFPLAVHKIKMRGAQTWVLNQDEK